MILNDKLIMQYSIIINDKLISYNDNPDNCKEVRE